MKNIHIHKYVKINRGNIRIGFSMGKEMYEDIFLPQFVAQYSQETCVGISLVLFNRIFHIGLYNLDFSGWRKI